MGMSRFLMGLSWECHGFYSGVYSDAAGVYYRNYGTTVWKWECHVFVTECHGFYFSGSGSLVSEPVISSGAAQCQGVNIPESVMSPGAAQGQGILFLNQ